MPQDEKHRIEIAERCALKLREIIAQQQKEADYRDLIRNKAQRATKENYHSQLLLLREHFYETVKMDNQKRGYELEKIFSKLMTISDIPAKSGLTVDWIPGELEMAGDNLRAEGVEQSGGISHERIWEWMYRNKLTLDAAAEELGISRRMLAYYKGGQKPVSRHIWLACLGWEAERQRTA